MQILPAALEWRRRIKARDHDAGLCREITFQLASPLAQQFTNAYVWPGGFSMHAKIPPQTSLIQFPLESTSKERPAHVVWRQAENYFGGTHQEFFRIVGFPGNSLGKLQEHLFNFRQTQIPQYALIFFAPYDPHESFETTVDEELVMKIARYFGEQVVPFISPGFLVPAGLVRKISMYGYVERENCNRDIWYWATQLLLSKIFVGCHGFFSQLAYLLGVPSIVLGMDNPSMCLSSNGPNRIVRNLTSPVMAEDVFDAFTEMGRLLLPEH